MKNSTIFILLIILLNFGFAQHKIPHQLPIIQTKFTADPAPMVYNDTVFLYTSHDEDDAWGFKMVNWLLFTSTDMVNWTEHGIVASLKDFNWARQDNGAWAVQCIERNGKFYLYCPLHGGGIGVLMADSPYGPFKDPLGKRLIETDHIWNDIDPCPFINDDGQAYLFWGNPDLYYVKLNDDMISLAGDVIKEPSKPKNYQEGPWVWKHKEHYYLAYASTCCPEGIGYAMSKSITGPWEYKGMLVDASELTRGNHPGIIHFKGKLYCFGHSYDLLKKTTSKFYERRSVDMDEFLYNADGTIQNRHYWSVEGPTQVETLKPFRRIEAETMAWSEGIKTKFEIEWEGDFEWARGKKIADRLYVTSIHNGDYIMVKGVDFASGTKFVEVSVSPLYGGKIEIRIDKVDGRVIATINIGPQGEGGKWKTISAPVDNVNGVHDVYFVFRGEKDLFDFDWWQLHK